MWGLRPKVVHCLYVPIIRPSISFASLVVARLSDGKCQEKTKQSKAEFKDLHAWR